ncbi:MAG: TetR/AcrR family transcriptional regulator [Pseudomonadota bacterium]
METTIEGKPRRKAPPEVRRQQLIDAAMETIAERGITGTTAAAVTRRAGLSLGIVSLHFDGMKGLLTETLRSLAEEMRDAWADAYADAETAPAARLRSIVDAVFDDKTCTPTKIAVWFAFFGEAEYRAVYREIVDEFDTEREEALADLCALVRAEGGYRMVDPKSLATSIECLADGLWLSLLLYPDWITPSAAREKIFDMIAAHFPNHFEAQALACDSS